MSLYERTASLLIGTPLQGLAESVRGVLKAPHRWKHPEMKEIFLEDERAEEIIRRQVKDGVNCIDVGSHLGSVLQKFVDLSPSGHHLAVEPIPYKVAWLRKKYPKVDIHQTALGEYPGKVEFFINTKKSGFSGMRQHGDSDGQIKLEVDCNRLDDLVPADRKIGFMKIDVEGAERDVFRGMTRILSQSRPVILFECTRSGLDSFGYKASEVYNFLVNEVGYQVYSFKNYLAGSDPLSLSDFEETMIYPFKAFNYIAAPK
jgi:FkbM family methyltransferase